MESTSSTPKIGILQRLYNKTLECADTPQAARILYAVAFAESSFFPLPPDLMLIPMVLANRSLAWVLAFWCSVSSVLGGLVGYAIGYFLFATIGQWVIHTYGLEQAMINFQKSFDEWGFWIIMAKGLTPIPYKLVTISSGVAQFDLVKFTLASIITRAGRFYMLSALLWYFGPWARQWIEKYLTLFLLLSLLIIVVGFAIVKYCFG